MDMIKLYKKSQTGEAHFTPGSKTKFGLGGRIFPGMTLVSNGAPSAWISPAKAGLTPFLQADTFYQKISCHFNNHTTIGHRSHALKNPRGSGGWQPGWYSLAG
jgi:hypothetical protein